MKLFRLIRRVAPPAAVGCALSILSGCSWPFPVNYAASSALQVSGAVRIGEFQYLPAEAGRVRPDQIANTSWQKVVLEQPVPILFHDAVLKELRQTGIRVHVAQPTLIGKIEEFSLKDRGLSIDWLLVVTYRVSGGPHSDYTATKTVRRSTGKYANRFGALNETIKMAIEQLLLDPAFVAAIDERN